MNNTSKNIIKPSKLVVHATAKQSDEAIVKDKVKLVGARELERQILDREGVQVILLCSSKRKFLPYPYKRALSGDQNLAFFRKHRLIKHIGKDVEFLLVKSIEDVTNRGQWLMSNLRASI